MDDRGLIIGYIAFSPAYVNDVFSAWYTLLSLAVLPRYQSKRVGSALVEHSLEELKRIHAKEVILVGDPTYYRCFGFVASPALGAKGMPSEYLLALALEGDIAQGDVTFHKVFSQFE